MKEKLMKVIYISSHGFGHMIRTIPLIEELLHANEQIRIICDTKQIRFLKQYFIDKKQINYKELVTDIGFINIPNQFTVNKQETIEQVQSYIQTLDSVVLDEVMELESFKIDEIYVDISLIGLK